MATVNLAHIRKHYGTLEILHGLDLDIDDGEFLVLVGPSGCGKSTAAADGRRARDHHRAATCRSASARQRCCRRGPRHRHGVPELRALPAHDGGRQHGLRPQLRRIAKAEIALAGRSAPPPSSTSPACSTAIRASSPAASASASPWAAPSSATPQVFLFDEPLSNLDAKLRVQMRGEIKELHQKLKTTAVYVTHDQIEAMTMADRIVVMRDGGSSRSATRCSSTTSRPTCSSPASSARRR